MADLVTLANVKSYLWPGESITTWDAILPAIISAVSDRVKREVGCDIEHTHYTSSKVSGRGTTDLLLPNWPITAVTDTVADQEGVTYLVGYDKAYVIETFCLRRVGGYVWEQGSGNFTVTYEAGYATIPTDIVLVCYEMIARAWKTMKEQGWGESGRTMPDGSTSTVSAAFEITKAQQLTLTKFKRPIL